MCPLDVEIGLGLSTPHMPLSYRPYQHLLSLLLRLNHSPLGRSIRSPAAGRIWPSQQLQLGLSFSIPENLLSSQGRPVSLFPCCLSLSRRPLLGLSVRQGATRLADPFSVQRKFKMIKLSLAVGWCAILLACAAAPLAAPIDDGPSAQNCRKTQVAIL